MPSPAPSPAVQREDTMTREEAAAILAQARAATEEIAVKGILAIFACLDPDQRKEVASEIQHNDEFCWHCGFGPPVHTAERPCQCWNDE